MCNAFTRSKSHLVFFLILLFSLNVFAYEGDAILDNVQPEGGGTLDVQNIKSVTSLDATTESTIEAVIDHDDIHDAATASAHDSRYYTETELDAGQLDNRYYTETELDAGQLDNRYYTETELDAGQLDNRYYTETELDAGQLDNRYFTETELESQANSLGASLIGIEDSAGLFTAVNVEAALFEVKDYVTDFSYSVNSITTVTGTLDSGDVDSINIIDDGDTYNVSEVAGTPGFDIQAIYTGIVSGHEPNTIQLHYSYNGNHTVRLEIWDFTGTPAWDLISDTVITNTSGTIVFETITIPGTLTNYVSGGEVRIRINHAVAGNITHDFVIDFLQVKDASGFGGGVTDHGQLAGLSDDDHPQYIKDIEFTADSQILVGTGPGTFQAESGATLRTSIGVGTTDSPTFTDLTLSAPSSIYNLNHDSFSGFVANEHINHASVTLTAGNGLTGGGTIAANRTFNVGQGTGITVSADAISTNDAQINHDALQNFAANEHFLQTAITNVSTALSTGLLKVTTGTGALSVVTDSSANWDTAYGWGNHATAGYLTSSTGIPVSSFTADSQILVGTGPGTFQAESGATLRTSIGVGTTDSPTFANVSLGTGELTAGSINRATGTLTLEIGGTSVLDIASSSVQINQDTLIKSGSGGTSISSGVNTGAYALRVIDIDGAINVSNGLLVAGARNNPDSSLLSVGFRNLATTVYTPYFDILGDGQVSIGSGTGELTAGSINRGSGSLTLEITGTPEQTITSTETTFGGNIRIPESGTIGTASDSDLLTLSTNTLTLIGNLVIDYGAYIGPSTDTDLIRLLTSNLTVNGNINAPGFGIVVDSMTKASGSMNFYIGSDPTFSVNSTGASVFGGIGELTAGSINRASGALTLEIGGTAEQTITSTETTFGGNLVIPDAGTIGSATSPSALTVTAAGELIVKPTDSFSLATITQQAVSNDPEIILHRWTGSGVNYYALKLHQDNSVGKLSISSGYPKGSEVYIDAIQIQDDGDVIFNQKVGIGTSPSYPLHVIGQSGTQDHDVQIDRTTSSDVIVGAPNIYFYDGTGNAVIQSYHSTLQFWNYNLGTWTKNLEIEADGDAVFSQKVGIGVSPSSSKLSLQDSVSSDISFINTTGSVTWNINAFQDGNFYISETGVASPLIIYKTSGNAYFSANVSADSFTDRTPFYEGDSLSEIMKIKGKDGQIDHSTLPKFVQRQRIEKVYEDIEINGKDKTESTIEKDGKFYEKVQVDEIVTDERDLGAMISMLTVAVQQLNDRIEELEKTTIKAGGVADDYYTLDTVNLSN